MPDAIFDQGMVGASAQALMQRRQQLAAQEAMAMGQMPQGMPGMAPMGQTAAPGSVPGMQPMPGMQAMQPMGSPQASMPQSQFSGYAGGPQGAQAMQMTPQQRAKLAALLQARDGQQP